MIKMPSGDKSRAVFARALALLAVATIVSFVAVFVWPTAYRTIPVATSNPGVFAAREQRFTGRVELLMRNGWRLAAPDLVDEYNAQRR